MLARARGELLVERERRDGPGRVVRVARPEERDLVPRVERVEVGQPAARLRERNGDDGAAGEERAALVHGIRGLGDRDELLLAERDLREREDRLLRAERRHELGRGVDGRAEAALDPAGDRGAQLGEPGGARVGRHLLDRRDAAPPG